MNGFVLYRGPSMIDGQPIVVVVTGLMTGDNNRKTGAMIQTYILRDGINPLKAAQTGADVSICGNCPHRGQIVTSDTGVSRNVGRSCYVTLFQGPRVVYEALQNGRYVDVKPSIARKLLANRTVRLGSYGDPGAVPVEVWKTALAKVSNLSGYTHQWRERPALADFCMASCDSEAERVMAKALGFRTFRVRGKSEPKLPGEGLCPASAEMGKAVQCAQCLLCGGARSKAKADITIIAHGAGRNNYERSLVAA